MCTVCSKYYSVRICRDLYMKILGSSVYTTPLVTQDLKFVFICTVDISFQWIYY